MHAESERPWNIWPLQRAASDTIGAFGCGPCVPGPAHFDVKMHFPAHIQASSSTALVGKRPAADELAQQEQQLKAEFLSVREWLALDKNGYNRPIHAAACTADTELATEGEDDVEEGEGSEEDFT